MAVALFITEQFIKDNTIIDGNVDDKYITTTIADSQKIHILPLLGTALYNEINDQVVAGSVTSLNQTLLNNYIQDALKYWVLVEGMDVFQFKVTNKGIMTKSSDNSQPVAEVDVIRLMDRNRDKAEYFSQRVTNYLIANYVSYPLFVAPGSTYDTVVPKRNSFTGGWALDDVTVPRNVPIDYGRRNYE